MSPIEREVSGRVAVREDTAARSVHAVFLQGSGVHQAGALGDNQNDVLRTVLLREVHGEG